MDLQQFISKKIQRPVVLYVGAGRYPLLFFRWLLVRLGQEQQLRSLDLGVIDFQTLQKELEVSFLGQSYTYWLGNVSDVPVKYRSQLLSWLRNYQGPNHILFFCTMEDIGTTAKEWQTVTLPEQVSEVEFVKLATSIDTIDQAYVAY